MCIPGTRPHVLPPARRQQLRSKLELSELYFSCTGDLQQAPPSPGRRCRSTRFSPPHLAYSRCRHRRRSAPRAPCSPEAQVGPDLDYDALLKAEDYDGWERCRPRVGTDLQRAPDGPHVAAARSQRSRHIRGRTGQEGRGIDCASPSLSPDRSHARCATGCCVTGSVRREVLP